MSRKVDYLQSVLVKLSQDGYKTIHGTTKQGQVRISKLSFKYNNDDIEKHRDDDLYISIMLKYSDYLFLSQKKLNML